MTYVEFSSETPCGFLICQDDNDFFGGRRTVLIQSDGDYPGVATNMGWQACECGKTDGTVDCKRCKRTASAMLSEAYDFIYTHADEHFDSLNVYFESDE
jgi:hypothetical protein